jgi:AAA ATPase domain
MSSCDIFVHGMGAHFSRKKTMPKPHDGETPVSDASDHEWFDTTSAHEEEGETINRQQFFTQSPSAEGFDDSNPDSLPGHDVCSPEPESPKPQTPLKTRRARNEIRNQKFLANLGLQYGLTAKDERKKVEESSVAGIDSNLSEENFHQSICSLLPIPHLIGELFPSKSVPALPLLQRQALEQRYPGRSNVIRHLYAVVEMSRSIPSVIVVVSGPRGTGKTSLVQSVLSVAQYQSLAYEDAAMVQSYVNASTLETLSIEAFVTHLYRSFQEQILEYEALLSESTMIQSTDMIRRISTPHRRRVATGEIVVDVTDSKTNWRIAMIGLGRSLSKLLTARRRYRAVLVVDHADCLSVLGRQGESNNVLSQLSSLPAMINDLPLTIVFISNGILLLNTRKCLQFPWSLLDSRSHPDASFLLVIRPQQSNSAESIRRICSECCSPHSNTRSGVWLQQSFASRGTWLHRLESTPASLDQLCPTRDFLCVSKIRFFLLLTTNNS